MDAFVAEVTRNYLLYFIIPFWLLVGFGDYLCHRASQIERTSGLKESLIHLLMFAEIGVPVTMGLHFEITSLVILISLLALLVHEFTAVYDFAYAGSRREVTVLEQHLHSYLAVIPFMVTSFVICLHWEAFAALFGMGQSAADFGLRWKAQPLGWGYHAMMIGMAGLLLMGPYLEEAWRCFRYQQKHGLPPQAEPVLPTAAHS